MMIKLDDVTSRIWKWMLVQTCAKPVEPVNLNVHRAFKSFKI